MSEYTPGSWSVECLSGDIIEIQDDGGNVVCVLGDGDWRIKQAILIAASPTMLAALEQARDWYDDKDHGDWSFPEDEIRAVIAKAKGGT